MKKHSINCINYDCWCFKNTRMNHSENSYLQIIINLQFCTYQLSTSKPKRHYCSWPVLITLFAVPHRYFVRGSYVVKKNSSSSSRKKQNKNNKKVSQSLLMLLLSSTKTQGNGWKSQMETKKRTKIKPLRCPVSF